jgi:hypothetical protein
LSRDIAIEQRIEVFVHLSAVAAQLVPAPSVPILTEVALRER